MQDRNAQKYKNKGIVQDILAQIRESYLDSRKENYEMNDILLFTKIWICEKEFHGWSIYDCDSISIVFRHIAYFFVAHTYGLGNILIFYL